MKAIVATVLSLFLITGFCLAADRQILTEETERINYSIGYQIGNDLKQQGEEINASAFLRGIEDALAGVEPRLDPKRFMRHCLNLREKS